MATDRIAQIETLLDAAVSAIASRDWETAETSVLQIELILSTIPDYETGTQSSKYREGVAQIRRAIEQQRTASGGIQTTTVKYVEPTNGSC